MPKMLLLIEKRQILKQNFFAEPAAESNFEAELIAPNLTLK